MAAPRPPAHPPDCAAMQEVALTNSQLAELCARAATLEERGSHRSKALDRAAHAALAWPEEAAAVRAADRPLTKLAAVGPWIAERLLEWLDRAEPPDPSLTPPSRQGFSSLAEARALLAGAPDWAGRLRGDLQMHTTWSDGRVDLPAMVAAALDRNPEYDYIAITDHTKGLTIAHGMDEERLSRQAEAVAQVRAALVAHGRPQQVLHAVEMNLSPLGEGDMEGWALARLDLVLGAFHSSLREQTDQTERYLRAVRNPTIDVLAHPRTRMWDTRAGLSADWAKVFEAATESGVAVELDGHPNRQDLDVETLRIAVDTDVLFSIGSDAHHPDELIGVELSLAAALRAAVPPERVIAFRPGRPVELSRAAAR
jgi:histidinol phosphatase-like PHP family hydrolase